MGGGASGSNGAHLKQRKACRPASPPMPAAGTGNQSRLLALDHTGRRNGRWGGRKGRKIQAFRVAKRKRKRGAPKPHGKHAASEPLPQICVVPVFESAQDWKTAQGGYKDSWQKFGRELLIWFTSEMGRRLRTRLRAKTYTAGWAFRLIRRGAWEGRWGGLKGTKAERTPAHGVLGTKKGEFPCNGQTCRLGTPTLICFVAVNKSVGNRDSRRGQYRSPFRLPKAYGQK